MVGTLVIAVTVGKVCDVVFEDLSKVYDRAKHPIMIAELESLGFGGTCMSIKWCSNYLSECRQQVVIGENWLPLRLTMVAEEFPRAVRGHPLSCIYVRKIPSLYMSLVG